MRNAYKPPKWLDFDATGDELNFEEIPEGLRFRVSNVRKHVRHVDVFVKRGPDGIKLTWDPPDQQPLCNPAIKAIGLLFFFVTLVLALLLTRSLAALRFHAAMFALFWISALWDKKVRTTLTNRIRTALHAE